MIKMLRLLPFIILLIYPALLFSQPIAPAGVTTRASTQLVYWFNNDELLGGDMGANSYLQVSNTNPTQGTWVHVQAFSAQSSGGIVECGETNFVDFLTPNDTHLYNFDNLVRNDGDSVLVSSGGSRGFVLITPVVSGSDLTAKSFQHMVGSFTLAGSTDGQVFNFGLGLNAVGRDAVDFATGEILEDNIPLDGTTSGLILIQPEELSFNILNSTDNSNSEVVIISFSDIYGESGLLGYGAAGAAATVVPFRFNFTESVTSCGLGEINCYADTSLTDDPGSDSLQCAGSGGSVYPDSNYITGWSRIFLQDIGEFQNVIGLFAYSNLTMDAERGSADYMYAKGEFMESDNNVPEDCSVEGDEDGDGFADCLDTDCATAEECETGETECADGMDNDDDGQADCADLGCDGFAGCEFGTETSCDDGVDNDADGDIDEADSDCQASDTGGDGGGGGCTVTASLTTATAAANFLLPLLPLFGAYGIRRIRNRK